MAVAQLLIPVLVAYLLGSVPTGYLLGRLTRQVDIRRLGDGSIGAAHSARELGPHIGVMVAALDILKGTVGVLLAMPWDNPMAPFLAGLASIAGHNWSIFLRFSGGRGAAPALGVYLGIFTKATLSVAGVGIVILLLTRSAKKACGFLFVAAPLSVIAFREPIPMVLYAVSLPALVVLTDVLKTRRQRHRIALRETEGGGVA